MLFFASSSPSQPTPECVQTAGVQGTNQAQAITNRCCLLRVPGQSKCSQTHQRKETAEFWPYMDLINRMRTDAEAGTSEMGEDTLLTIWWSDSIGVFFKEFRRGNTKGSRFLWRLVGFSRRSRIFPRNPTLGIDFPTTLEMGRVLRCPSPFCYLSAATLVSLLLWWTNNLCVFAALKTKFTVSIQIKVVLKLGCVWMTWQILSKASLFTWWQSWKKLLNHASTAPVYLNGWNQNLKNLSAMLILR